MWSVVSCGAWKNVQPHLEAIGDVAQRQILFLKCEHMYEMDMPE
jgi:hypothetical protein